MTNKDQNKQKAIIVSCDIITSFGMGVDKNWQSLLSGQTAIKKIKRFNTDFFDSSNAATIGSLYYKKDVSLIMQMLVNLLKKTVEPIPDDAFLIMATTTGEIDYLEKNILAENEKYKESRPGSLLSKTKALFNLKKNGVVISSACASSNTAIAQAVAMIQSGVSDCALVVACDCVSEFVFAGFSSLMALDRDIARPFDRKRKGLNLGESAGYILLMSESRASVENRDILAEVAGWGLSCDANHMTGPLKDGSALAEAISNALQMAKVPIGDVGCVSAHGTGTIYNDSMEMKALKKVFGNRMIPTYSIKGAIGHSMGASGLIEAVMAIKALLERTALPTANLRWVDPEAKGWVSPEPRTIKNKTAICNSAGFGGANAVIVIKI